MSPVSPSNHQAFSSFAQAASATAPCGLFGVGSGGADEVGLGVGDRRVGLGVAEGLGVDVSGGISVGEGRGVCVSPPTIPPLAPPPSPSPIASNATTVPITIAAASTIELASTSGARTSSGILDGVGAPSFGRAPAMRDQGTVTRGLEIRRDHGIPNRSRSRDAGGW
jgi:hypothetical protein